MNEDAMSMTGELAEMLEENDVKPLVDPRTVPVRFSTLKLFAQSPLHYLHGCQNQYEETLSMRLGTGAHAILFDQPIAVYPGKVRRGKEYDAWLGGLQLGTAQLNKREHALAVRIATAIKSHRGAMELLFENTAIERRLDWTWSGRAFRSTPDAASSRHIVDLKCLKSAQPDRVQWQSRSMHYHAQSALYRRAMNSLGADIKECYLVVVENKAPFPVTVLRFSATALDVGDRLCVLWDEQRRNCESTGEYPGYVQSVVDLDLPDPSADDLVFGDETETEDS